jgi:hypothetical protein
VKGSHKYLWLMAVIVTMMFPLKLAFQNSVGISELNHAAQLYIALLAYEGENPAMFPDSLEHLRENIFSRSDYEFLVKRKHWSYFGKGHRKDSPNFVILVSGRTISGGKKRVVVHSTTGPRLETVEQ